MKFAITIACLASLVCTAYIVAEITLLRQENDEPLLVVVLMVKDEAHVIRETLKPFVDAGVQHYFIFDTGSTDGTIEVVTGYFAQHNVAHAIVEQEPFVDFATSRNRALELAEERFPHATFMIMFDAEWYLQHADELLAFCEEHREDEHDAYLIHLHVCNQDKNLEHGFYLPRLIRPRAHLRFVDKTHERLEVSSAKKIPHHIVFDVKQSPRGAAATRKRLARDLDQLLQDYSKDSENTRTIFFLAQTHISLGNLMEAYHLFCLCCAKTVIDNTTPYWQIEQAYQASYNAGVVALELAKSDARFTWSVAHDHFVTAFTIAPRRAEPLMRIAQHYWDAGNMHLCFVFARQAADLQYPEDVTGLVEPEVYRFKRYDLLGACAGNIGRWDVAEWAVRKAIEAEPGKHHLHTNLTVILERKSAAQPSPHSNHYEL